MCWAGSVCSLLADFVDFYSLLCSVYQLFGFSPHFLMVFSPERIFSNPLSLNLFPSSRLILALILGIWIRFSMKASDSPQKIVFYSPNQEYFQGVNWRVFSPVKEILFLILLWEQFWRESSIYFVSFLLILI